MLVGSNPILSLVVATKGRATPLQTLFDSLEAQSFRDFEVIVVDQNSDARVGAPEAEGWPFPVTHLRNPGESGASRARNAGFAEARGSVILFPDDDCWYPPDFLENALRRMELHEADVLAGRAADANGFDINGRFETAVTRIDRRNVWTTGIEWVVLFKRDVLAMTSGYDVDIGIGAATPWQSCEAQDIMLRAVRAGYVCMFDPDVFGHHAELDIRSDAMRRKGRTYARGFGYVLRRHRYSVSSAMTWIVRPIARASQSILRGDRVAAGYYVNVALGRFEGWQMKLIEPRASKIVPQTQSMPAVPG